MAVLSMLAALAGCASDDRSRDLNKSLNQMRVAVDVARSSETEAHAQSELSVAAEKLTECRNALDRSDITLAERLLTEAEVNLALARAKVDAARARAKLEDAKMDMSVRPGAAPDGSPATTR
jgi:hypothetical protein